ncbi:hypothetical protein AB7849_11515 [Rhodanobacter sp. 115]|uniref:hypothetical protein n=1 Tax=Rhodanobacter sp. FW021-MT20 TaxID=1162282 RepID=UPI0012F74114|nr:hypothetical protein [Rhodanobacter sp. 115]
MKSITHCDGCNNRLDPDRTLVMGIGHPEVMHYICFPCALKLNDGDDALNAHISAAARRRANNGVIAA